jgi:L-ascorbate metabolism protein UlaG (beta-lactamase superfamily)
MVKVTFIGHSCFLIENGQDSILIDPYITGNPYARISESQKKANYIMISHGHGDHLGDAIDLARENDATIIANYEICIYCSGQGVGKTHALHVGGGHTFSFGSAKLTIAHHGSTLGKTMAYGGVATGIIVRTGGKIIYHAGDTGLFLDMKLIGELDKIDLALLPVGGGFTMDINDAARAIEFLNPKAAIPMHFGSIKLNEADAQFFKEHVETIGVKCIILESGENYNLG